MAGVEIRLPERLGNQAALLRPLRPDDAGPYAAAFKEDPELGHVIGIEVDPDEASARERIARQAAPVREADFLQLAIADPASAAFRGVVIAHSLDEHHRRGEVGLWLIPTARRRGLGRAALSLVIPWLFDELHLLRIEMTTTPDNHAIAALAAQL